MSSEKVAPAVVKLATAGVIDSETFAGEVVTDLTEQMTKDRVAQYETEKNAISEFKDRLSKAIEVISSGGPSKDKPLVFFIDELDRCRPNYAIELLERIKHVFDVNGIVFVLALDKRQIGHSIRAVYGSGLDVDGYLRRFIDLEYTLPDPDHIAFPSLLADQFGISKSAKQIYAAGADSNLTVRLFAGFAKCFGLSLRAQQQSFAAMSIILVTGSPMVALLLPLIAGMLAIKAYDADLYSKIISGEISAQKTLEMLADSTSGKEFMCSTEGTYFEAQFLGAKRKSDSSAEKLLAQYRKKIRRGNWWSSTRGCN